MTMTPWAWQLADVAKLRANNFTGLLNIDPGGTKTMISTLAIKESGASKVLITAPKSTHEKAWRRTIEEVLGVEARVIGNGNKAAKQALFDFEMGYDGVFISTGQFMTRTDVSSWSGDMYIADEIHQLSTMKSRGQRKLSGYVGSDGEPLAQRFGMRLALSGTPARQDLPNLWGILRFLWPELRYRGEVAYDNAYQWMADRLAYEEVYTNQIDERTGKHKTAKKWLGEKNPGQLLRDMPCVVTHFRRQRCCNWHPNGFLDLEEPQELEHFVELVPAQKKAIRELEESMMTYLRDQALVTDISLTQKQRVRQICLGVPEVKYYNDPKTNEEKTTIFFDEDCVSPFLDETLDILSKLPKNEPVVIYLDSQVFAEVAVKRLNKAGIAAAEYSGKTSNARDEYMRDFGTKYQVLVMVSSAGATGTDGLQLISNTEIILETPVSLTVRTQAESRQDRLGAKKQVQRYRIIDSEGYATGRLSEQLMKQIALNRSLRSVS